MAERALHGVNLSGWLSLESWVTPELFADTGALDEPGMVLAIGRDKYQDLVKRHRESFLSQRDFTSIAARGFNAVRLTVPWYAFGDDGPDPGPFVGCIDEVDAAFDCAEEVGLGIVLVLGISPGLKNSEDLLVRTHDELPHYKDDLIAVAGALAGRYATRMAMRGIELADEPRPQRWTFPTMTEGVPLHQLRNYYREAYRAIRQKAGDDVTVIVPDAGMHGRWSDFMAQRSYRNVWLDSHFYHYRDTMEASGPSDVRRLVDDTKRSLRQSEKSGLPVMVGEWCSALPLADSATTPEGRIALERVYAAEQIGAFSSCPAWFFQTWKTSLRLHDWDARIALASFERRMLD